MTAREIKPGVHAIASVHWERRLFDSLMRGYPNALCISGTHGKTTTTSMCTHIMMAAEKDMNRVVTGVKGVFADDKETLSPTVKGVFSLSGVKVASDAKELNTLPKGIYIVNGKKYVVK